MPESSPITIDFAGLMKDICIIKQLRPTTKRESGAVVAHKYLLIDLRILTDLDVRGIQERHRSNLDVRSKADSLPR